MKPDQNKRMKVLFLPKWYPHRYDPMPGLFVQLQAEAVSLHCDVAVLYIHEDPQCINDYEIITSRENNTHVVRIYYKRFTSGAGFIGNLVRLYRFFRACWLGFRNLRDFSPDLLHVHVLTRLGFIALFYKLFTRTPYVITEHWSRYFPQNDSFNGLLRKGISRHVVHFASAVVAVSEKLKKAMIDKNLYNLNFRVIPNPVDMDKFNIADEAQEQKPLKKTIIHISCFEDKSKNISGLLKVIKQLSLKRNDFECVLVGDGPDWIEMKDLAKDLELLDKFVFFSGMKEQNGLVELIRKSDFLILSSHYETFGSVVIESLACGVPVLATDVGIVSEVLDERNGMIISPGDKKALEAAIDLMLGKCRNYDKGQIRKSVTDRFNNKIIGEQLYQLYVEILTKRS
jgi:glycosyltransferase involved in cell wall biosynthesis